MLNHSCFISLFVRVRRSGSNELWCDIVHQKTVIFSLCTNPSWLTMKHQSHWQSTSGSELQNVLMKKHIMTDNWLTANLKERMTDLLVVTGVWVTWITEFTLADKMLVEFHCDGLTVYLIFPSETKKTKADHREFHWLTYWHTNHGYKLRFPQLCACLCDRGKKFLPCSVSW